MGYAGEVLNACGLIEIDFTETWVVAVSGDGPNVCGHLLLYAGNRTKFYYHVAELHGHPRYMDEGGYRRYLAETGKTEITRRRVGLPNPDGALIDLENLMARKWLWAVVPNNCVTFAEEVIAAGGGTWASLSNCPAVSTADGLQYRIQLFLNRLENEIRGLYGVPR